jgi:protein ImuA
VDAALWRGDALGSPITAVVATGWNTLDAQLPGGGWPCHALTEVLQPQPSVCEWRLLGPALASVVRQDRSVVVVGPPKAPHLPGLRHAGLDEAHLLWIRADSPAHRLWATEQLIRGNGCGAVLAWLPQARPEQLRRLQVLAQGCDGLVFLLRPEAAQHEASPAPLRVMARHGPGWTLQLAILKRKGPRHEGVLALPSVPGGLQAVLTPRLTSPNRSSTFPRRETADVLGSAVARLRTGHGAVA